ncbi:virulence effector SrfC [Salmonella enterica subsp. diarizonae]|nr:virulence effector SrfC [Salmonella enterica subsp. diarizonae]EDW4381653.1 virulence effector SrfC [Salmonella enterica subsp. diarizonae]EEC5588495.1 virulence effector SrfC [Salmonella enterica subsp. diarizonae]EEC5591511.1 virulence effector SrfC [Salmonella enterica subsp. diarizonae]MIO91972.1 virulence effector SrfC [Salmonella enterica subsp. diarizonae]
MTKPLNATQAVIEWVNNTRRYATRLDDEADALLAQLTLAAADESALNAACASHGCVGLYGYAQSAKAYLLTTLCGNENGKLEITTPDRNYDYFSHINPGHAPANMAIRFTRDVCSNESGWPLRLRLISEAELVQLFIAWTSSSSVCRQVEKSIITSRLEKWQSLRQPQPVPGVTAEEVAAIARFWRSCLPSARQHIDDATWQHFASLLPAVDLTTRAHAWALLWGEQPEITQQWLALAHMLQQTGHAEELAAPLSLLVDHFGLPAENFLTQMALTASDTQSDVVVHPVKEGRLLNAVSLSLDSLALLTRELVLTVENSVLDNVDLLDIPVAPGIHPHPLWRAKLGWMLAHYRQQVQPDVLVICNALASRSQTSTAARHLLEWVNATQPQRESALPGVVWAITPQDARFATQQNLDEAVQQLMGKPGVHWGTLQALDKHSMQRLVEWLSQATSAPQRQARLQALREQLRDRVRDLLPVFDDARLPVETVIRRLQAQAARHGDLLAGLLPPIQNFDALLRIRQSREEQVSGLFNDAIDLFADEPTRASASEGHETGYQAHKMWINHLRQWARCQDNAQRLGLEPQMLNAVADILITASYRLGLPLQLQKTMQREEVSGAQLHAIIGNFIAWLGYTNIEEAQRPVSRVQKGAAIFAATQRSTMLRLTKLDEQPVHAASRYVYDWLVALYTLANENAGYLHPQDITDVDREQLIALIT